MWKKRETPKEYFKNSCSFQERMISRRTKKARKNEKGKFHFISRDSRTETNRSRTWASHTIKGRDEIKIRLKLGSRWGEEKITVAISLSSGIDGPPVWTSGIFEISLNHILVNINNSPSAGDQKLIINQALKNWTTGLNFRYIWNNLKSYTILYSLYNINKSFLVRDFLLFAGPVQDFQNCPGPRFSGSKFSEFCCSRSGSVQHFQNFVGQGPNWT